MHLKLVLFWWKSYFDKIVFTNVKNTRDLPGLSGFFENKINIKCEYDYRYNAYLQLGCRNNCHPIGSFLLEKRYACLGMNTIYLA